MLIPSPCVGNGPVRRALMALPMRSVGTGRENSLGGMLEMLLPLLFRSLEEEEAINGIDFFDATSIDACDGIEVGMFLCTEFGIDRRLVMGVERNSFCIGQNDVTGKVASKTTVAATARTTMVDDPLFLLVDCRRTALRPAVGVSEGVSITGPVDVKKM